jgi:hypothetical protein
MSISLLNVEIDLDLHTFCLDILQVETSNHVGSLFSIGWWYGVFDIDFLFRGGWIA